jgi:hypothetical protein
MKTSLVRFRSSLTLMAASLAFAACAGDVADVTAPSSGLNLSNNSTPPTAVRLVKRGPAGTTATFEISATGGTLPLGSTVTLEGCAIDFCPFTDVWYPTDDASVNVTITEVSSTGNAVFDFIAVSDLDGFREIYAPAEPTVTVRVNSTTYGIVRFKNVEGPDDEGFAGCTPGFWRQDQHFEFWTAPYTPGTMFGSVFTDAFPGQTLLNVVEMGGGGLEALGRHTVAALLNAASPDVDYGMTPADVIAAFNAAVASGDYETQKDIFEGYNERGCTAKD